jgi:glycosyltransferase involved in cell wall biosynthesis
MSNDHRHTTGADPAAHGLVYLACPWGPFGGGMYKVADYLSQAEKSVAGAPSFKMIDSRGPTLAGSPFVMLKAMAQVASGALTGRMSLLHVNMAHGLSVFRKGLLIYCASLFGRKTVLHLHASKLPQFYERLPGILKWMVRRIFLRASCVITLGDSATQFVTETLTVPSQRVVKLTNGVPRLSATATPRQSDAFHILFLGSQFERKGLPDLLKALALPNLKDLNWKITVAGGDDATAYREETRRLGIAERVEFTGWVTQEQAGSLLAGADVMVLPSYDEGLPLVILEALGAGIPVICTPVGEIPQFLTDRDTALFVPTGQPQKIADALAELISEPSLRAKLSQAGRTLFDQQFSLEAFTHALVAIYGPYCGYDTGAAAQPADSGLSRLPRAE